VPQATQAPPFLPQAPFDGAVQVEPAQQPAGQEVASQTQRLPTQRFPAPHAGALPHWQTPLAEQVSAVCPLHATQAFPPLPQALTDGDMQLPAEQQPFGHEVESQTQAPNTQRFPAPQAGALPQRQVPAAQPSAVLELQATHAAPPAPQAAAVGGEMQVLPEQQPVGQETALQPQVPPPQL